MSPPQPYRRTRRGDYVFVWKESLEKKITGNGPGQHGISTDFAEELFILGTEWVVPHETVPGRYISEPDYKGQLYRVVFEASDEEDGAYVIITCHPIPSRRDT